MGVYRMSDRVAGEIERALMVHTAPAEEVWYDVELIEMVHGPGCQHSEDDGSPEGGAPVPRIAVGISMGLRCPEAGENVYSSVRWATSLEATEEERLEQVREAVEEMRFGRQAWSLRDLDESAG